MYRQLDKFERIAWESVSAMAILGNPGARDFELIGLQERLTEERRGELFERGMEFLGVIGTVAGCIRVALEIDPLELGSVTLSALSQDYLKRLGNEKATTGDSTEFLQRLYGLTDSRSEMN